MDRKSFLGFAAAALSAISYPIGKLFPKPTTIKYLAPPKGWNVVINGQSYEYTIIDDPIRFIPLPEQAKWSEMLMKYIRDSAEKIMAMPDSAVKVSRNGLSATDL